MNIRIVAAFLTAVLATASVQASSQATEKAPKKSTNKSQPAKKSESSPDVSGMLPTPYDCDLGDKLTIFKESNNDQQIALHWKKHKLHMHRVPTTTGAERYENKDAGLVWIGIPAKGMLLDSKKGRQLANECRNEAQKQLVQK